MKTIDLDKLRLTELDVIESRTIGGGDGLAHAVGTAIRFFWKHTTEGYIEAVADYAANKVLCDCD